MRSSEEQKIVRDRVKQANFAFTPNSRPRLGEALGNSTQKAIDTHGWPVGSVGPSSDPVLTGRRIQALEPSVRPTLPGPTPATGIPAVVWNEAEKPFWFPLSVEPGADHHVNIIIRSPTPSWTELTSVTKAPVTGSDTGGPRSQVGPGASSLHR